MFCQPRLALTCVQTDVELGPLVWGLVALLRRVSIRSQVFSSQARLLALDGGWRAQGPRQRHLDSWLMTPQVLRAVFAQGSHDHDLSLVFGAWDENARRPMRGAQHEPISGNTSPIRATWGAPQPNPHPAGTLRALVSELELPLVVVLDASRWDDCAPPQLPAETRAVILLGAHDEFRAARLESLIEAEWQIPVLGSIATGAVWQAVVRGLQDVASRSFPQTACEGLATELARSLRVAHLLRFAAETAPLTIPEIPTMALPRRRRLRVALAYDEAFHCYFPDTLECLEKAGVRLVDFSPLKGETIPRGSELVWLGCGHPELYAEALSRNVCMRETLQCHVRCGGRVYAEGGGVAYLCQTLTRGNETFPMAGLLPAHAIVAPQNPRPIDVPLVGDERLPSMHWRGYLQDPWRLEPSGPLHDYSADCDCPLTLVRHHNTLASRIPLHVASHHQLLERLVWQRTTAVPPYRD